MYKLLECAIYLLIQRSHDSTTALGLRVALASSGIHEGDIIVRAGSVDARVRDATDSLTVGDGVNGLAAVVVVLGVDGQPSRQESERDREEICIVTHCRGGFFGFIVRFAGGL